MRVQRGTGNNLGYVKVGRKKYLDLAIGGYRGSSPYYTLAYRPVTLYKNVDCDKWSFQRPTYLDFFDPFAICEGLDFDYFITTMSKIKHEDGIWKDLYSAEAKQLLEASNKTYEYNNAICTFAGDKACYNDTDLVVVNYDLDGNYSQFDNIKVFKDGIEVASFVEETVTKSSEYIPDEKQQGHAININKELEEEPKDISFDQKMDEFMSRGLCSGNFSHMYILPTGDVTICEELYWNPHFLIGDVKKQSLLEIWTSEKALSVYNLKQCDIPKDSACADCEFFSDCRDVRQMCYRDTVKAYGEDKWYYPDVSCPKAPKPFYDNKI